MIPHQTWAAQTQVASSRIVLNRITPKPSHMIRHYFVKELRNEDISRTIMSRKNLPVNTWPTYLLTFVVFFDVCSLSIDFEVYSAIFLMTFVVFSDTWLWSLFHYFILTLLMLPTHLLTLKCIPLCFFVYLSTFSCQSLQVPCSNPNLSIFKLPNYFSMTFSTLFSPDVSSPFYMLFRMAKSKWPALKFEHD